MDSNVQSASIIMRQYGGPDVLRLETVSLSSIQPDEIRIRSLASAINHSDLEIRVGNWPILTPNPFPYTPGLEVVGEVVEVGANVSDVRVGDRVITMMQGLGGVRPQRPGGYAEYVVVRANAVAAFAGDVDPLEMAALGLASVTAFEALRKIGDLSNRRIAVTCRRWGRLGGSRNSEGARGGGEAPRGARSYARVRRAAGEGGLRLRRLAGMSGHEETRTGKAQQAS